jgi:predicted Zn-dependent protease
MVYEITKFTSMKTFCAIFAMPGTLKTGFFSVAALGACLLAVTGCATNPVSGEADFVLMSEEQEIAMGKQNHVEVMKQYKVYEDPELQAYVAKIGQKLALAGHRGHLEYTFTLLDSPQVNAFALPGGYIYITRGIMAYMNNEEQLAGVLGHELGHVTARHGVRQHGAQTAASVIGILATIATGSQQVAQASSQLSGALVSGYGRQHELEADRLGAEYLARTGYDPEKMLGVVGILKDQEEFELQRAREEGREPRVYHGVYASHPENDDRLQEVIRAADKFKNPDARQTDPEVFLGLMKNVTFGDSEDQGIVREHRFYHKVLNFTVAFPQGWRIENQPTQLVAIRQDGAAAMIVNLDQLQGNENASQFLHRKFPKLEEGQKLDKGAYTGTLTGKTPFGVTRFRVTSIPHGDRVFIVAGFAKENRPDQDFLDTADSIRKLKSSEIELATAKRIDLVRAKAGDSFEKLAIGSGLGKYAEDQLRLLNGMYPDGEPHAGQLIKIIR